jgi:hypothetical protein
MIKIMIKIIAVTHAVKATTATCHSEAAVSACHVHFPNPMNIGRKDGVPI